MPRVWICYNHRKEAWIVETGDAPSYPGIQVDMNASVHRQVVAADKTYQKFQRVLEKFFQEGVEHPDTVRRVR